METDNFYNLDSKSWMEIREKLMRLLIVLQMVMFPQGRG